MPSFNDIITPTAAAIDADGYVIALARRPDTFGARQVVEKIDVLTGTTEFLFEVPEPLGALAISPEGVYVAVSQQTVFDKKTIYRFSPTGELLSKVAAVNMNPTGIDYDKDGRLIAISVTGCWVLNPVTGVSTSLHDAFGPSGLSDIDVSDNGEIRVIAGGGKLRIYSLETGLLIKETTLQYTNFTFSPLIHR